MRGFLFDVDQTLTNEGAPPRRISARTKQALDRLWTAGHKIGVCTGRHYAEIRQSILPIFPPDSLHVTAGGGELVDSEGQRLWSVNIPGQLVRELCHVATGCGSIFVFGRGDTLFGSPEALDGKRRIGWEMKYGQYEELNDWSTPLLCIQQVNDPIRQAVMGRSEITVKQMYRFDGSPYFDITATGVTKALGVEQWAQRHGLALADITGFGDSENDLEFLQVVGHGVAMGNATEQLKKVANQTIGQASEDGVAAYLESLEL